MQGEPDQGVSPDRDDDLIAAARQEAVDLAISQGLCQPAPNAVPGYMIVREIGRGGMGVVYEAEQQQPRRGVALKLVRGGVFADEHRLRLFQREAETLARLQHPAIATIHETGQTNDGYPFFAMELVRGVPLTEYVKIKQMPLSKRLALFCQVCEAVNYAHQREVIHRDLKPSNILVDAEGNPRILDFGLARFVRADADVATASTLVGNVAGTLPYMSPEQARGGQEGIDTRADVYSLGVILYELITGELPYDLGKAMLHEGVRIICEQAPRKPSTINRVLRGEVETIVMKALEKEPARRYQSTTALSEDIERYLAGQPILAHPPSAMYQLRKLAIRHKLPIALAGLLFVAITAFAIVGTVQSVLIADQRDRIAEERDRAVAAEAKATRQAERVAAINEFFKELPRAAGLSASVRAGAEVPLTEMRVAHLLVGLEDKIAVAFPNDAKLQAEARAMLANAYLNLGMHEEAEDQARLALDVCRAAFGDEHLESLSAIVDLGFILHVAERHPEAEELFQPAYEGLRKTVGDAHPQTIRAGQLLASVLLAQERHQQAEPLMRRTFELQRRVPGDYSETLWSLKWLAKLSTRAGRLEEGEALARELIQAALHATDDKESDLALLSAMTILYEPLVAQGRYAAADSLLQQYIAICQRVRGTADPTVLHARAARARILGVTGEPEQAEATLREILATQREFLGASYIYTRFTMLHLGKLLNEMGRFEEAEELCLEGAQASERLSGETHSITLRFLIEVATAQHALGRLADAETNFRRVERILGRRPDTSPKTAVQAQQQRRYGRCLADLERYAEAEAQMLAAYESELRTRGEDHPDTRRCLESLVALYEAWDRPEEAAEYRDLLVAPETIESAERLAQTLIRELGAASSVIEHLEHDESLPEAVCTRALQHARNHVRDTETCVVINWWFLQSPIDDANAYRRVLEQAQAACRLDPENGAFVRSLSVAQYRVGAYEDALTTLGWADETNATERGDSHPTEVAFIAMAYQRLGQTEQAQTELHRLRALMQNPGYAANKVLQAFLREAEALIVGETSSGAPVNESDK